MKSNWTEKMLQHNNSYVLNRIYGYLGIGLVLFAFLIEVVLPALAPHDPNAVNISMALQPPNVTYPFGSDRLGRCVLSRTLYGASVSLSTTFILVFIALVLGTVIGLISGYAGGLTDSSIMRVTDVFLAFPNLVLAIAVAGILGPGLLNTGIAIISTGWTKYARLTRGLVIMEKKKNYIIAAKLSGAGVGGVIGRYLFPNIVSQILVIAAVDIGGFLLAVAGLSFLGLGAQPPTSEWGYMLFEGKSMLQQAPWLTLFPGMFIFGTVCLFNFLADFLRDLLDPQEQTGVYERL